MKMQAKPQFAHFDTFSRKGNSRQRSIADICAEAARLEGATPHVESPQKPKLLYGVDPALIPQFLEELVARQNIVIRQMRSDGKPCVPIRRDTHLLVGLVFSYPISEGEVEEDDVERWLPDIVDFAHREAHRTSLKIVSIVCHRDEGNPHVHVLAVADPAAGNPRLNVKKCHDGHVAQDDHLRRQLHGPPSRSFKAAMRKWQDRYYDEVGSKHGQARYGPRRQRLSRAQLQNEKSHLGRVKELERDISEGEKTKHKLHEETLDQARALRHWRAKRVEQERIAGELKTEKGRQAVEEAQLAKERRKLEKDQKAVKENETRVAAEISKLQAWKGIGRTFGTMVAAAWKSGLIRELEQKRDREKGRANRAEVDMVRVKAAEARAKTAKRQTEMKLDRQLQTAKSREDKLISENRRLEEELRRQSPSAQLDDFLSERRLDCKPVYHREDD